VTAAPVQWACERTIYAARPQALKSLRAEVRISLADTAFQRRAQPHDVASINMVTGRRKLGWRSAASSGRGDCDELLPSLFRRLKFGDRTLGRLGRFIGNAGVCGAIWAWQPRRNMSLGDRTSPQNRNSPRSNSARGQRQSLALSSGAAQHSLLRASRQGLASSKSCLKSTLERPRSPSALNHDQIIVLAFQSRG
jgi:nitroreductase